MGKGACSACQNYLKGGTWFDGLPDVEFPSCVVSGREAQFAGYWIEPMDGEVRYRSITVAEMFFPTWLPVPSGFFAWATCFCTRRCLRDFQSARQDPSFKSLYNDRV